jgi:hypothetical protein
MSTTDPFELNKAFGAMKPLGATPNKIARLTSVAGTKVKGVPKTQNAGATKKIATAMGQKSSAFGMRTSMTNGRVAGVRTQNAMTDLRATMKPKKKGLLGKAADPFDVAKADKKTSTTGRKVTAAVFPGYHGAIAGKKGKRLRSLGNEAVGATAGGLAGQVGGALAGAALTRGEGRAVAAKVGGAVGGGALSAYGGIKGNNRNQRKGYLKGRG